MNLDRKLKGKDIFIVSKNKDLQLRLAGLFLAYEARVRAFSDQEDVISSMALTVPDLLVMEGMGCERVFERRKSDRKLFKLPILNLVEESVSADKLRGMDFEGCEVLSLSLVPDTVIVARLLNLLCWSEIEVLKEQIGFFKHELVNDLAVIDGKLRKLQRIFPDISENEAFQTIMERVVKFEETLQRFSSLRR
ncbi:hypothetical protein [Bdellovibrio svalbardensis]|uniref:Uncharacterized protein n=1 Tax=Bdellovibrio svalbardensis TaxID=2972972 RepID=A0ABT6DRR9_9BACT|nr:hypothetical protein [Bdellovibrio svalbardensis]MDG0817863.1 hypothetical protein [Bdellovibrio svalbardensis]